MNPYTSTWTGAVEGQAFHLVLLDNGRSRVLADEVGRQALRCIRCSACLNVCPVYERTGGHAYGSVYPGPIGAILSPQLRGMDSELDRSLPFASTLCGACYDACPVAIDIPEVLVHLRAKAPHGPAERAGMRVAGWVLDRPVRLARAQRLTARFRRLAPRRLPGPPAAWTDTRDIPDIPPESFRNWWVRTGGGRR
jgi:L-lactate dehydrogenase complex protein LldF